MTATYAAFAVAFFFAMNIGASGAAASMGAAYGAGAVSRKRTALLLCGAGVMLGAVFGGGEVVRTIGSGIVPPSILNPQMVVLILASAAMSLFIANMMGIPLSTSEVTVGAVVGAGIAFRAVYGGKLAVVVLFWVIIPIAAFLLAFAAGKWIGRMEGKYPVLRKGRRSRSLALLLAFAGFLEAFSAGMNNVANAVGPLVGAGLMSEAEGVWFGGVFVAIGALVLGGRVLETNGKRITEMSLLEGSVVSGTGGILVIGASLLGLPVPLTQVTSSAIIGIGTAKNGFSLWQKSVILQMILVWAVSPVFSLVIAYGLIKGVVVADLYSVVAVVSVFLATAGSISLLRTVRRERQSLHEHGGGI